MANELQKGNTYNQFEMVSLYQNWGDLGDQRASMEIMGGSEETPVSLVRLYKMEVQPIGALDMSRNLHVIIGYVLRDKSRTLGV